jgi:hypothetical protein
MITAFQDSRIFLIVLKVTLKFLFKDLIHDKKNIPIMNFQLSFNFSKHIIVFFQCCPISTRTHFKFKLKTLLLSVEKDSFQVNERFMLFFKFYFC